MDGVLQAWIAVGTAAARNNLEFLFIAIWGLRKIQDSNTLFPQGGNIFIAFINKWLFS